MVLFAALETESAASSRGIIILLSALSILMAETRVWCMAVPPGGTLSKGKWADMFLTVRSSQALPVSCTSQPRAYADKRVGADVEDAGGEAADGGRGLRAAYSQLAGVAALPAVRPCCPDLGGCVTGFECIWRARLRW